MDMVFEAKLYTFKSKLYHLLELGNPGQITQVFYLSISRLLR